MAAETPGQFTVATTQPNPPPDIRPEIHAL